MRIERPGDPRLGDYVALRELGHRPDGRCFVAESAFAVERLLRSGFSVRSVLGTAGHLVRLREVLAGRPEVEVYEADQGVIQEAVGFNFHRGVAACGERPAALRWDEVSEETDQSALAVWTDVLARPRALVLVAQGLHDPANVGSIVRSARAFGVDLVALDRRGADPLSRRAIRAAMGNVFAQPVVGLYDLPRALAEARGRGAQVLAATVGPGARPLGSERAAARRVLLVGSEGFGLPEALLRAADEEVTIPIAAGVDSLGVAAATAVLLYGLARGAGLGL